MIVPPSCACLIQAHVVYLGTIALTDQPSRFAGLLLEPEYSFVDGVRHGRDPLSVEAHIRAGLLRKTLCITWRMEQRPFKFVSVEFVLEVDVERDNATISVVGLRFAA